MLLTYSFPKFGRMILSGKKKHTLREDPSNRWREGMSIQHWMGNPRNKRRNPLIHKFHDGQCGGIQMVSFYYNDETDAIIGYILRDNWEQPDKLTQSTIKLIIKNDGLTRPEFIHHFFKKSSVWSGKIIHFTDLKY